MADKKVDATTGEVQEEKKFQYFERPKESLEGEEQGPISIMTAGPNPNLLVVHCKPVYNYQSVEFDVIIRKGFRAEDLMFMEALYSDMLRMLVRVSEKAPQKDFKPVQQVEEPATEKQIEVMNTFHIKYPKDVTRKQAQELIKANISAVK